MKPFWKYVIAFCVVSLSIVFLFSVIIYEHLIKEKETFVVADQPRNPTLKGMCRIEQYAFLGNRYLYITGEYRPGPNQVYHGISLHRVRDRAHVHVPLFQFGTYKIDEHIIIDETDSATAMCQVLLR